MLDVPYEMIDLMLELAYVGSVGGLALNNISQVLIYSEGFAGSTFKSLVI